MRSVLEGYGGAAYSPATTKRVRTFKITHGFPAKPTYQELQNLLRDVRTRGLLVHYDLQVGEKVTVVDIHNDKEVFASYAYEED